VLVLEVAQEGFEPSASLVLSESGLPVAYRAKFRGLESNQRPPRSERGVTTSSNCPGVSELIREEGLEPSSPESKSGSLPVSRFPSRKRQSDLWVPLPATWPETIGRLYDLKSGIGDSNPGRLVGSQESCRWTNPAQSTFTIDRAEGEGVEPSRLIARLISNQMPSPVGLPFRIAGQSRHRREESNFQLSP
jgi:hypothetical protein